MNDVRVGGRRRIDRVLAPDYLAGLSELPADRIVAKHAEAESEDAELSYLAHLLEGRIEVVLAEQGRRVDGRGPDAPDDGMAGTAWRNRVFRGRVADPLPPERHRRRVERLVHDVDLSDVTARSDGELDRVLRTYRAEERNVSDLRERVRDVVRRCADELDLRAEPWENSGSPASSNAGSPLGTPSSESAPPPAGSRTRDGRRR